MSGRLGFFFFAIKAVMPKSGTNGNMGSRLDNCCYGSSFAKIGRQW